MDSSEYFVLFSNNGRIKVQVKFKDFDGTVSAIDMEANEIDQIISPETGKFRTMMTFDDWPFEVYKYEIDPIKNRLIIRARKLKS